MIDISVADGKYKIVFDPRGVGFKAYRYGEDWRDLTGDGLILALVQEIEDLRGRLPESGLLERS